MYASGKSQFTVNDWLENYLLDCAPTLNGMFAVYIWYSIYANVYLAHKSLTEQALLYEQTHELQVHTSWTLRMRITTVTSRAPQQSSNKSNSSTLIFPEWGHVNLFGPRPASLSCKHDLDL
jgi:hypothetical protein